MIQIKRTERNRTFLGFDTFKDFKNTLFSLNYYPLVVGTSIVGGLSSLITNYIYPSSHAIITLLCLILFDTATGVYRSYKLKTFSSQRLPRVLLVLITYVSLLSLSYHLAKDIPTFSFLPSFLYFGFCTTLFISILENLNDVQLLPKGIVQKLLDYFRTKQDEQKVVEETKTTE